VGNAARKDFPIHEQVRLAFRAELYGALKGACLAQDTTAQQGLRLGQSGVEHTIRTPRLSSAAHPDTRPAPKALSTPFSIVMTVEDGQLMTQATRQPKFPLFAESDTKFFLKVVDAQVEFFRDEKGAVTHLVLHQGGRDAKAPRK
jgi:Domain of unknown function (DUF3471)